MVEVNRNGFVLFMFMMIMIFMPAGNPPRLMSETERRNLKQYLERSIYEIEVVNNSTWESGFGNLTGIKEYPGDQGVNGSILPYNLYSKVRDLWNMETNDESEKQLAYFRNISATLKGTWERVRDLAIEPVDMPIPNRDANNTIQTNLYPFGEATGLERDVRPGNLTIARGNAQMSFDDDRLVKDANVSYVTASVSLSDDDYNDPYTARLQGLHLKNTGNLILSSSSLKFAGLHALPHLLLDEALFFEEAKRVMVKELNDTLSQKIRDPFYGIYEEAEVAAERCEYVFYGHMKSSHLSREELEKIEKELEHPLGRPHGHVPNIAMDGILYSPDCGFVVYSKVSGERNEQFFKRTRLTMMGVIALVLVQTIMTALQMKDTSTPSTISRVSLYSVALMAILDGSVFMTSFVSSLIEEVEYPFLAVTFLACTLVSLFEIPYMDLIYRSQRYEVVADARAREATGGTEIGGPQFVARPDGSIGPALTLPTTEAEGRVTPSPNLTTIMDQQDERQLSSMIYSRYFFVLFSFMFLTVMSVSWPSPVRHVYEYTVLIILYSYWVPQIYRNIRRGSRRAFLLSFVISMSLIRLVPILYVCLVPNNILSHRYDPVLAAVISGWQWIQVLILLLQSVLGPRFFLPRGYLPDLYDYHPIITEEDLEAGFAFDKDPDAVITKHLHGDGSGSELSSTSSQSESERPLLSRKDSLHGQSNKVDCAICMNEIDLVIVPRNHASLASTPANVLARRRYMVTPCRHVFHTECMEQWMRTKLQCPVCRNPLPPI